MNRNEQALTPSPQILDAVIDSYVRWREKSAVVDSAYRSWTHAASAERAERFDDYLAALDREEDAATAYKRRLEEAGSSVIVRP